MGDLLLYFMRFVADNNVINVADRTGALVLSAVFIDIAGDSFNRLFND